MDKGELVTDALILEMMEIRFKDQDCKNGFILDGFPRTTEQALALDKLLIKKELSITAMVSLKVEDKELIKRLLERGKSSGRSDDQSEKIISNRIKRPEKKSQCLIQKECEV